jgi:hypothetical protein
LRINLGHNVFIEGYFLCGEKLVAKVTSKLQQIRSGFNTLNEYLIGRCLDNLGARTLLALNHAVSLQPPKGLSDSKAAGAEFITEKRFAWQVAAQWIFTIKNASANYLVDFLISRHRRPKLSIAASTTLRWLSN